MRRTRSRPATGHRGRRRGEGRRRPGRRPFAPTQGARAVKGESGGQPKGCGHQSGWTQSHGEARCDDCGTRRFTDYGALRPAELPQTITPPPRRAHKADRAAARHVARIVRRGIRWGTSDMRPTHWAAPASAV
ncbi:DUF6255 family natural product biosynthesis protein [Streptomyces syringium]|uniref:DUF6255 family natural product biosynthesis protein n=1 Tax=Streptomyces syringium TaxID=76729 RepID=UPI0034484891